MGAFTKCLEEPLFISKIQTDERISYAFCDIYYKNNSVFIIGNFLKEEKGKITQKTFYRLSTNQFKNLISNECEILYIDLNKLGKLNSDHRSINTLVNQYEDAPLSSHKPKNKLNNIS